MRAWKLFKKRWLKIEEDLSPLVLCVFVTSIRVCVWELIREIEPFFAFIWYNLGTLPHSIFLVEILLSSLKFSRSFTIMAVFKPIGACLEGKEVIFWRALSFSAHGMHYRCPRFLLQRLSIQWRVWQLRTTILCRLLLIFCWFTTSCLFFFFLTEYIWFDFIKSNIPF